MNKHMKSVMWSVCCEALSPQSFAVSEEIFSYQREATGMYFLKNGNVEYVYQVNDVELPLDPAPKPRESISEGALWTHWSHQGKLTALTPAELISVNSAKFCTALSMHPHPWFVAVCYGEGFIEFLKGLEEKSIIDILRESEDEPKFFSRATVDACNVSWRDRYLDHMQTGSDCDECYENSVCAESPVKSLGE